MSEMPESQKLSQQLKGRWQIPLLIFSTGLLVAGIMQWRPKAKEPSFEEIYQQALEFKKAGFFPEASQFIETKLNEPQRSPKEKQRLYGLLAEVIFDYESMNVLHGENNTQKILEYSAKALAEGEEYSGPVRRMRGTAWQWLGRPEQALEEYQQALMKGIDNPWDIRKRIIKIQQAVGGLTATQLQKEYEAFLSADNVSDELRYWAIEQMMESYAREGKYELAQQLLADHYNQFQQTQHKPQYDYLQALAWFHVNRLDDAERLLRSLRDQTSRADPLYAKTGWLLGRIMQEHERPEYALAFFDDVVGNAVAGPYRTLCVLGQAESLARLQRYDESVEAYNRAIRMSAEDQFDSRIDLQALRQSTTLLYQELLSANQAEKAMAYLKIAARLVPLGDDELQAFYSGKLASLYYQLGMSGLQKADAQQLPDHAAIRIKAKHDLLEAGREYQRLAKLVVMDESASADAIWQAADAFDHSGERGRTAEVLEAFVRERPESVRTPEALRKLGDTYQAAHDYRTAIKRYQQNLIRFPRTYHASMSLVPLADCFTALDELDRAEQTLLRVIDRSPDDPLSPLRPDSEVYKEALFRLGDLYLRTGKYEKSIARYEEALERYPQDYRVNRTIFNLAEAHRKSAVRIRGDLNDSRNIAYTEHLQNLYRERLTKARKLFDQVIERYRLKPEKELSELDRLYVKLSHFYRADMVYDLSLVSEPSNISPYAEALEMYDRASYRYMDDPMAMTAYVQMINCYIRMGNMAKASYTLNRARYGLRQITDEQFKKYSPDEDRSYWENYLNWLENTGSFTAPVNPKMG